MIKVQYLDHYVGAGLGYNHPGDSGFDLKAAGEYFVDPGDRVLVKLGFKLEFPNYMELQIRSRSGISFRKGLVVVNSPGTIDSGYRGEIMVVMHNIGTETQVIELGDRVAQGVFSPVLRDCFVQVKELSETSRGEGGYGSTGR